jgi:hypothetical protein
MNKGLLIALVLGLLAMPTLSLAGASESQYVLMSLNQLGDQELAVTSGQGWGPQAGATGPGGRQVATNGSGNSAVPSISSGSDMGVGNTTNVGANNNYTSSGCHIVDNAIMINGNGGATSISR